MMDNKQKTKMIKKKKSMTTKQKLAMMKKKMGYEKGM